MTQNIEVIEGGLTCDNTQCDWEDPTIPHSDAEKWIDRPCPKCGENLLTKGDYDRWMATMRVAELINTLTPDQLKKIAELSGHVEPIEGDEPLIIEVGTHKTITLNLAKESDLP